MFRRFLPWLPLVAFLYAANSRAEDIAFRVHAININSEFIAAAAIDVNHDGELDVVCGSHWYEAPTWTPHFLRSVEVIGNRPDGYAHLPIDLNRDDRLDLLLVNWRSKSLQWVEQPIQASTQWQLHVIDTPGNMETGRLFDIDRDGQLDVLPNGSKFAAWWAIDTSEHNAAPKFTRCDLPPELAGHGIGCGDINGDGRPDIVGQFGWAEAPERPRVDRWFMHNDFNLGRASVPILVVDVDDDNDNDIVFSMGHDYGSYWLENQRNGNDLHWVRHTIDASFSGGHSPLWADLDDDGRNEFIVGKRYLPHEGADPGEFDPLVGYRYQFDTSTRTWQRWTITENEPVGYGLDPKVVDLDADDDLDLLCGGRNGLYWLENLGNRIKSAQSEPLPIAADDLPKRTTPVFEQKHAPKFAAAQTRFQVVQRLLRTFGDFTSPIHRVPLEAKTESTSDGVYDVTFNAKANLVVKAKIRTPKAASQSSPAIILAHEGNAPSPNLQKEIDEHLAAGFVVMQLELNPSDAKELESLASSAWKVIRCIDVLETWPQVDRLAIRLSASGSTASQAALLANAVDARVRHVKLDGLPTRIEKVDMLVPSIAQAIVPRPLQLVNVDQQTDWTSLEQTYESVGSADQLQILSLE